MKHLRSLLAAAVIPAAAASTLNAQSLLLHWTFDEASSGTAATIDYGSSPQIDGRFFTGATRTANTPGGYSLGALDVTAGLEAAVLANFNDLAGKLDNLTSFTFSTWINMQGTPAANQRILRAGNTAGFGIRVVAPSSGTISAGNFGLTMDLGGGGVAMNHSINADNTWVFLAFTFDASASEENVKLYVGTDSSAVYLASSATTSTVLTTGVIDSHFTAGKHPAISNRGVPGYLDDVRIYSGAGDAAFVEGLRLANIPEPRTYALLFGIASAGIILLRRRRS